MMIDFNNSKSLPDTDKVALAAREGVSVRDFAGVGLRLGRQSWQQHYESLLVDPFAYYQDHFGVEPIFRYLQMHPDMDHMSGLHRFFWLERVLLLNFWDVPHGKELDEESFGYGPYNYQDWLTYTGAGRDDRRAPREPLERWVREHLMPAQEQGGIAAMLKDALVRARGLL
jgi:competence protein ComEC